MLKTINNMILTLTPSQIKDLAPSVFSTNYASKLSSKYSFVPTEKVLEKFIDQGWDVSSVRQVGRGLHSAHEVRMSNTELPQVGDSLVQAIVRNSHDGTKALTVGAGLYRLVCSNGLTVPTSVAREFTIRHKNIDLDDVRNITEGFAEMLPVLQTSVNKFQQRELKLDEAKDFMGKATLLRWGNGSIPSLDMNQLLIPNRDGDKGLSLWNVFNVAQEKLVRGGSQYRTGTGRYNSVRQLRNFGSINRINTKLWELAETYC